MNATKLTACLWVSMLTYIGLYPTQSHAVTPFIVTEENPDTGAGDPIAAGGTEYFIRWKGQ